MENNITLLEFQLIFGLDGMTFGLSLGGLVLFLILLLFFIRIKNTTTVKTELTVSTKFPFKVEELITALGGKDNIDKAIGSYSKIKFMLVEPSLANLDGLKKFSTGIIEQSTGLTLIFGNISKPLAEEINNQTM